MEHAGFPSDETLAAFIDGRVDVDTRTRVIEHMSGCSECYSVFIGSTEMPAASAAEESNVSPFRRARWAVAAAAVAAAAAIGFFVTPAGQELFHPAGLVALADAAPASRTFQGRLTGFPYRQPAPVSRGAQSDPSRDPANYKLLNASAKVQQDVSKSASIENLHAFGVSQLLLGNADGAVQTLRAALDKRGGADKSEEIALLNDYAAALSSRASQLRRDDDAALAATVANRAWSLQHSPETAWNRAVSIESLRGTAAAESAWRDYLALDSTSDWAREARTHLARQ